MLPSARSSARPRPSWCLAAARSPHRRVAAVRAHGMSSKKLKKRESRQAASAKSKAAPPSPRPTLSEQFARLRKEQESAGFAQLDADGHIDERNAPKNYTAAEHVSQLIVDIVVIYISYCVGLSTLEDYFSFEERGWLRTLRLIIGVMWLLWACTHLATVLIGYVSHGVYVRGQSTFADLTSDISVTAEEGIAKSRRVYPGDLQRQKLHRCEIKGMHDVHRRRRH